MPAERVPMRDAREIIRLKFSAQVATREIARRLGMAPSTVRETLRRLASAGLSWPLPEGLSDTELEAKLYAFRGSKRGYRMHAEPDWRAVHREMKRKHVTLQIVWDEYIATHPGGYSYSRFCELFRGFEKTLSPTMRQSHAAGERLFVDYAGDGVPVLIDARTGELRKAQIFVAVLGAPSLTFAYASWTQTLPDWIDAHVRALEAIGGVPELIVPDNTKTAVIKACLYEPQVNGAYTEMAAQNTSSLHPSGESRARSGLERDGLLDLPGFVDDRSRFALEGLEAFAPPVAARARTGQFADERQGGFGDPRALHGGFVVLGGDEARTPVLTHADAGPRRLHAATADALPGVDVFGHLRSP